MCSVCSIVQTTWQPDLVRTGQLNVWDPNILQAFCPTASEQASKAVSSFPIMGDLEANAVSVENTQILEVDERRRSELDQRYFLSLRVVSAEAAVLAEIMRSGQYRDISFMTKPYCVPGSKPNPAKDGVGSFTYSSLLTSIAWDFQSDARLVGCLGIGSIDDFFFLAEAASVVEGESGQVISWPVDLCEAQLTISVTFGYALADLRSRLHQYAAAQVQWASHDRLPRRL